MNYGITISFVIGGLLLLTVLSLDSRLMRQSGESALELNARQRVSTISEVMQHDMRRLAFKVPESVDAILVARDNRFKFRGDMYDGDGNSYNTVEWYFDDNKTVSQTNNPDDRMLYRIFDGDTTRFTTVTTAFEFSYYNDNGVKLGTPVASTQLFNINKIRMDLTCETADAYGQDYQKTFWSREFMPANLQLR